MSLKRPPRPGFLATFSLVGLVAIVGLAVTLSRLIGDQIRSDQLDRARASAQLLAESAIGPVLRPALASAEPPYRRLDRVLVAAKPSAGFDTVVALSPRGRVLYANDHRLIGRSAGASPLTTAALHGETTG